MPNRNYWWFILEDNEGDRQVFVQSSPRKLDEGERYRCNRSDTVMERVDYLQKCDLTKPEKDGTLTRYIKIHFVNDVHPRRLKLSDFMWNKNDLCKALKTALTESSIFANRYNTDYGRSVPPDTGILSTDALDSNSLDSQSVESKSDNEITQDGTDEFPSFYVEQEASTSTPKTIQSTQRNTSRSSSRGGSNCSATRSDGEHAVTNTIDKGASTSTPRTVQSTQRNTNKRSSRGGSNVSTTKRAKTRRPVPTDFAEGAIPPLLPEIVQSDDSKDVQEEMKKEIEAASIGDALLNLDCLEISADQTRTIAQDLVQNIVHVMEEHSDNSYQAYCVVTTNLDKKVQWTEDKANGFMYEVLGGQHNMRACEIMRQRHPDNKLFKTRRCQVYHGHSLSLEAKLYLGVMHNKVGDTRRSPSTREELIICRRLYNQNRGNERKWRKLCGKLIKSVSSEKDVTTALNLAKKSDVVFKKINMVMKAYEEGQIKRRTLKEDVSGAPIKWFPLYHLRTFGDQMSDNVAIDMLDRVLDTTLPLPKLDSTAKVTQHLQNVQAALMGEFPQVTTWNELSKRFPQHTSREILVSQFGKIKLKTQTHVNIKLWAQQCLHWESSQGNSGPDKLQGCAGSIGLLMVGDAVALDTQSLKKAAGMESHGFRLCFLDKPKDWTLEQVEEVMITVTSLMHQSGDVHFTFIIFCEVTEVRSIMDALARRKQFIHLQDCYYHVKNAPKSAELLTPALHGFVVANRITPEGWQWSSTINYHNFLSVKVDQIYQSADHIKIDPGQKPEQLYHELINIFTTKQQWILDLCCGTGTGQLVALKLGRNVMSVDKDVSMINHARGRFAGTDLSTEEEADLPQEELGEESNEEDGDGKDEQETE